MKFGCLSEDDSNDEIEEETNINEIATPIVNIATPIVHIATPIVNIAKPIVKIATPIVNIAKPIAPSVPGSYDDDGTLIALCPFPRQRKREVLEARAKKTAGKKPGKKDVPPEKKPGKTHGKKPGKTHGEKRKVAKAGDKKTRRRLRSKVRSKDEEDEGEDEETPKAIDYANIPLQRAVLSGPTQEVAPRYELCAFPKNGAQKKIHIWTTVMGAGKSAKEIQQVKINMNIIKNAIEARNITKNDCMTLRKQLLGPSSNF